MRTLPAGKYQEYLKKVLDLELELYQLRRLKSNIKNQLNISQNFINHSKAAPKPTSETSIASTASFTFFGGVFGATIGFTIWLIRVLFFLLGKYSLLFFIGWLFVSFSEIREAAGRISTHVIIFGIIGAVIGFVIAILPGIEFLRNKKRLEREHAQKESNRQKLVAIQKKNLNAAYQMYQRCDTSIKQTEQLLNQYYSLDIIYKKYRGLVPVATIYEYFEAGLCTELMGHEGAYLIYERQLQANIIIGKLDQIIDRLDQIIENQRLLAQSIQTSNRMIDGMSKSIQNMVKNQEVNNYYSRISAKNTQFLADYTFYKEIIN